MMSDKMMIGTVVKLKSDGPYMTVNQIDVDRSTVTCIWYSDDNKLNTYTFHINAVCICLPPDNVSRELIEM